MYSIVHSLLEIVLERLLTSAGLLTKGSKLAEDAAQHQAWQVLSRRFTEIRDQRDGREIVSFLVHHGHGCFAASLVPAAALQSFLGYNETRGTKFEPKQLFTDFWMTVAQASQEVERLLCLARRHAEVAITGLHSAGLRDEAAVMVWLRKYGRNEGERIRLQEMLDRMGVGVGSAEPTHELMFALRHNLDLSARTRAVTVYGAAQRMATQTSNGLVKSWVKRAEKAAALQERQDSLTAKAIDSRGMNFIMRSSTPTLLTDSHDEDDTPGDYADSRQGQGGKRWREEGGCLDDDGPEEQALHASSEFADKVQDYMREQRVSQTQLAHQVGLRQQQISRWMFGKGTSATRQAVERRLRGWLKKRSVTLEDSKGKNSRNRAAKAGAKAGSGNVCSKPSLMHGHAGKKRKHGGADGVHASGRRARLADTPADAYANDFAYTLHKYIKQVGLSQEKLGQVTGLRQQQISSYMFRKCSETMHNLVEKTLRKWLIKEKIELPGFTTAQLKGKPIQWRPRQRPSANAEEADTDSSEESDESSVSDDEPTRKREPADQGRPLPKRHKPERSFYCSEGSQLHGVSLSRRPVSKAQAMEYARIAAKQQQPVRLPFEGAFIILPSRVQDGGISSVDHLAENGVNGMILRAQDGEVIDVKPGTTLFKPGGRMKVGYDGNGGITLRLVSPLMQVASKAQAHSGGTVGAPCDVRATVKPAVPPPWVSTNVSLVKPAVPPPRTLEHPQMQQVPSAAQAETQAKAAPSASPSSEPDDEPSESKASNLATPAQLQLGTEATIPPTAQ